MKKTIFFLGWAAGEADASDKSVEIMRKFSEQYARRSSTFFCSDKSVTAVVIKVLLGQPSSFFPSPILISLHHQNRITF
jgi:ferredoxin-thioredoxin reductase catalytic chain